MTHYSEIINKEMLEENFVNQRKTSRQIAREFHISRRMVNKFLLDYGFINVRDLEDNDLP